MYSRTTEDEVSKLVGEALRRAFRLGEAHWEQSTIDSPCWNRLAANTYDSYKRLLIDTEVAVRIAINPKLPCACSAGTCESVENTLCRMQEEVRNHSDM